MIYILASLGIPTLACMVHAQVNGDKEAVRGGLVFLGMTLAFSVLMLPVIGVD